MALTIIIKEGCFGMSWWVARVYVSRGGALVAISMLRVFCSRSLGVIVSREA